jgi:hypothetical protein
MLEVVAVLEDAAAPFGIHPVVVGGMAVFYFTGEEQFTTVDVDVVMPSDAGLEEAMADLGFVRHNRHWTVPGSDVFIEAPSAALDPSAEVVQATTRSGRHVRMLSLEDVIVDRLDQFLGTGARELAIQLVFLLTGRPDLDWSRLETRADDIRGREALKEFRKLADAVHDGAAFPESDELHALARRLVAAEYPGSPP